MPPVLYIVAGPHGSGKTTFAESYFQNGRKVTYVNPDIVAAGLSPGREEAVAVRVGRVTLEKVKDSIAKKETIGFESTLSGRTWLPILEKAKARNYQVTIYFLRLKNVGLNLKRIQQRVKGGGHDIPKATVLRRYGRSVDNFWSLYRPICDNWYFFDNSNSKPIQICNREIWEAWSSEEKKDFAKEFLRTHE